eukprot:scaffold12183_cov68-Phaeocystis_antarctica.AAC.17
MLSGAMPPPDPIKRGARSKRMAQGSSERPPSVSAMAELSDASSLSLLALAELRPSMSAWSLRRFLCSSARSVYRSRLARTWLSSALEREASFERIGVA